MTTVLEKEHGEVNHITEHVLYRVFDDHNVLLYVGITNDPVLRFRTHRHEKPWWKQHVHTAKFEYFYNRADLEAAEKYAIRHENPVYNIASRSPDITERLKNEYAETLKKRDTQYIIWRIGQLEREIEELQRQNEYWDSILAQQEIEIKRTGKLLYQMTGNEMYIHDNNADYFVVDSSGTVVGVWETENEAIAHSEYLENEAA